MSTNAAFMDWHVEDIKLKELWNLKWHKKYDLSQSDPRWPAWMEE